MRTLYATAAGAALIVFTASIGAAAPKQQGNSPSAQARVALEQIDDWSASAATITDRLEMFTTNGRDPLAQRHDLDALRENINNIASELQFLAGNRSSVAEWQVAAVDQVTPLMAEIAANLNQSIQLFNSERVHLWATAYHSNLARIYSDTRQVKGILDGYLKLASVHQEAQRIENRLGESLETR